MNPTRLRRGTNPSKSTETARRIKGRLLDCSVLKALGADAVPTNKRLLIQALKAYESNPTGPAAGLLLIRIRRIASDNAHPGIDAIQSAMKRLEAHGAQVEETTSFLNNRIREIIDLYHEMVSAAENGEIGRVEELLDKGVPTELSRKWDYYGYTPLMKASLRGHIEIVRLLDERGAMIDFADDEGRTALFKAAGGSHEEVARFLLSKKADVHFRNKYDETPLFSAASSGSTKIAEMFLDRHADIHAKDDRGWTAYVLAVLKGHSETADFLRSRGARTPEEEGNYDLELYLAAATGNNEKVQEMKDKGADVNKIHYGSLPLGEAASSGHTETVRLLIDLGADGYLDAFSRAFNAHKYEGKDRTGIMKLLLDKMIEAGPDENDETALFHAVRTENVELVDYVLDKGVDPGVKNYRGETAKDIKQATEEIRARLEEHEQKQELRAMYKQTRDPRILAEIIDILLKKDTSCKMPPFDEIDITPFTSESIVFCDHCCKDEARGGYKIENRKTSESIDISLIALHALRDHPETIDGLQEKMNKLERILRL